MNAILLLLSLVAAWQPPKVTIYKLPNGLQLYFLEDHSLPIVEARILMKVGDVNDPADKVGLADIAANVWVTGGTDQISGQKTPTEADNWLDARSIHLTADSGKEITQFKLTSLSQQWQEALSFLGEVMLHPRWDADRFALAVNRYKESLRRDEDEPATVSMRAFMKALYGEESPLARIPTDASLSRIKTADLKDFYKKYFQPNRMILAVAGDFSSAQVQAWVQKNFGNLVATNTEKTAWETIPFVNKPNTKKINKKLTQTFIEVGHLGLKRFDKEEYAYGLLQYILGGEPFVSRLGSDIRSDKGLAYSVYSDWEVNPARGFFRIHVETRADAQEQVLKSIRENLERLAKKGDVTEAELKNAKDSLLNKYIFLFDSSFKVVFQKAKLDMLGFPPDYLEKYPANVRAVTLQQLNDVARQFIQPDKLTTILVGP